ncbi:MAG TPA: hypothetical protein VFK79_12560 [Xanthobacteraceae bacterium]|nr:hypothetical protein [Xanthobacteraceae bacterium]
MLKTLFALLLAAFSFAAFLLDCSPAASATALSARTSDASGVRVVVTPKALEPGGKSWEFDVVMDTHTKPLDENLSQMTVLVDESGNRHKPVGWKGDPPGGHHRKGILQFSAPGKMPSSFELQITGVGGAGTRIFRWDLK